MTYKYTTLVQNVLFDKHLPTLTGSELKVLLVVVRKTNGWIDKRTGLRKRRDRISISQFMRFTGLSRRVISLSIDSLIKKSLVSATDYHYESLDSPTQRKGRSIYFSPTLEETKALPGNKFGNISGDMERMKGLV